MGRFARQNESFCSAKWAILECKMSHFESPENIKKIQVTCFQRFKTSPYFAHTRPPDFNFRKMALTEAQIEIFVRSFHKKKPTASVAAGDLFFYGYYRFFLALYAGSSASSLQMSCCQRVGSFPCRGIWLRTCSEDRPTRHPAHRSQPQQSRTLFCQTLRRGLLPGS